jgi:hypothetical protein
MIAELVATKRALPEEKAFQSAVDLSLAEEKAARQTAEQSLQTSDEARVNMAWDLVLVLASLTATTSKSSAMDIAMIRVHGMEIKLKATKEKLKTTKDKIKSQGQLLDSVGTFQVRVLIFDGDLFFSGQCYGTGEESHT